MVVYAPSLHFKRLTSHVLKKIAPSESPVYTSEVETALVTIFKEMQAREFGYMNADRDFDNFLVDGAYASEELLSYIRKNHIKLTTIDKINLELELGLFEGDYDTSEVKGLTDAIAEKFRM